MTNSQLEAIESVMSIELLDVVLAVLTFGPIVLFAVFPFVFNLTVTAQPEQPEQPEFEHFPDNSV